MMMPRFVNPLLASTLLALWSGAPAADVPQHLEVQPACLFTDQRPIQLALEHAVTPRQRQVGLMERTELSPNQGMVFLYDEVRPANAGFWMYRTRISLDIAWLDHNGRIVAIDTMTPCESEQPRSCPTWAPGHPHRNVLELPAGFFDRHNVTTGDRLVVNLNDHEACAPGSPETPQPDPLD